MVMFTDASYIKDNRLKLALVVILFFFTSYNITDCCLKNVYFPLLRYGVDAMGMLPV